jgi:hypothetical protein
LVLEATSLSPVPLDEMYTFIDLKAFRLPPAGETTETFASDILTSLIFALLFPPNHV